MYSRNQESSLEFFFLRCFNQDQATLPQGYLWRIHSHEFTFFLRTHRVEGKLTVAIEIQSVILLCLNLFGKRLYMILPVRLQISVRLSSACNLPKRDVLELSEVVCCVRPFSASFHSCNKILKWKAACYSC